MTDIKAGKTAIVIDPATVGTPQQGFLTADTYGTVDLTAAPVPDPNNAGQVITTNLGSLIIPSAAGQFDRDAYIEMGNQANAGILPNESTDPGLVYLAVQLSNALQQEFVDNPESGHNKVQS